MQVKKILMLLVFLLLIYLFFYFELHLYLTLENLKSTQLQLAGFIEARPLYSISIFFGTYVLITALSLPGAAIMTLAAGALFGLYWGTVVVSFASTIGATLAFLISRYLFRDIVQQYFGKQMRVIDAGVRNEGAFYLLSLRLIPLFPFFVINLVMGLTRLKTSTFFLVSQLGMLPGTIVYVNAGMQLSIIESLEDVLSPALIISLVILGLFPLIAKNTIGYVKRKRAMMAYKKPEKFDNNLVVIGAGSAGLVAAYIAAAVKAKVTLIEKHKMGGDCLNTGCVPSKALIRSARFMADVNNARAFGFNAANASYDFPDIMGRVHDIIKTIEPHDSVERYTDLGVNVIQGEARIASPYEVEVNGKILTTRSIIIATGARPFVPPMSGLKNVDYLTSDSLWNLTALPEKLVVLGAGPIGCEMAQAIRRLGSQVTQIESAPRILPREDEDVSNLVANQFQREKIDVKLNHKARSVQVNGSEKQLICEHEGKEVKISFDKILVAIGRKPNTEELGLEELGIGLRDNGTIDTNEYLRTTIPNIYASGDVTGPYQFTHTAAHQSWYAAVNALFGFVKSFKVDYSVIPWTTFTSPEVARVGISEQGAIDQGILYEISVYNLAELDRAITDSDAYGMVKVLTVPNKDRILGVTIVGENAGEMIAEFVLAMKHGLGLNKILGTIHTYPTMVEANKYVAGVWRKKHQPKLIMRALQIVNNARLK